MLTEEVFSSRDVLKLAWQQVRSDIYYFVKLMAVFALVWLVPKYISDQLIATSYGLAFITSLAAVGLQIGVVLGLIGICLKIAQGMRPPLAELFAYFHLLWKYILASLLYAMVIFVGLLLLVIPAFVWGVKYSLFAFFIVDKKVGPLEALRFSAEATRGHMLTIFIFLLILLVINFLCALLLGIGLLISLPVTYLAWTQVYLKLAARLPIPQRSAAA